MATCGSLQHIFQKPLPENPTLLESLSPWKQIKSMKPIEDSSSFTEIFGELHFKENHIIPESSSSPLPPSSLPSSLSSTSLSSSPLSMDLNQQAWIENLKENNMNDKSPVASYYPGSHRKSHHSDSFSSMNSESLSLCTEGLGFESSDDLEDLKNDMNITRQPNEERGMIAKNTQSENLWSEPKRSRKIVGPFPPPISCIGRSGKPWVCLKSYRHDGRFILKEIRIPTQDFLHASREDGRLKLQFIQSDDEILEVDEEEEQEDVEGEEGEKEDKGFIDNCHVHVCDKNEGREENSAEKEKEC